MSEIDGALVPLERDISEPRQVIEARMMLIDILEREGHDVDEREAALQTERGELAGALARRFVLVARRS